MNKAPPLSGSTPTAADLIGTYVELRDQCKAADEKFAKWRKEHFDTAMTSIESQLLDQLNKLGSDSIKTKKGTAYKKMGVSVTTADASEFRRHVIGGELWDLIVFTPAKGAINELIAKGEELPPGLNRTTHWNVNVNRPKGDREND